jgi:PDZ domain-containing protein
VVGHVPDGLHIVKVGTLDQARTDVEAIAKGDTSGLAGCS